MLTKTITEIKVITKAEVDLQVVLMVVFLIVFLLLLVALEEVAEKISHVRSISSMIILLLDAKIDSTKILF